MDRFTSFEGNTGPYILYTIVRIKSILNRYLEEGGALENSEILPAASEGEKTLMLAAVRFGTMIENAFEEKAPHKICSYIYELANEFNRFYHETEDPDGRRIPGRRPPGWRCWNWSARSWRPALIFWDFPLRRGCKSE